jgi:hypothetical protein
VSTLVTNINDWLSANQTLVVSLGVPLTVALVTYLINRQNRIASAAVKVAEFRQAWINTLRESVSEFLHVFVDEKPDAEKLRKAILLQNRITLLMNQKDEDYDELVGNINLALANIGVRETQEACNKVRSSTQRVLKREWNRVKSDLKNQKVT